MANKIRIGVFGAFRGKTMIQVLAYHPDAALVAVCDRHRPLLDEVGKLAEEAHIQVALYEDFEEFFQHDMDAVVLANYANEHAPYAIRLLRAGRHVLSEVLPCQTMAEAVALIEAVEESGKVYAYAENYAIWTTPLRCGGGTRTGISARSPMPRVSISTTARPSGRGLPTATGTIGATGCTPPFTAPTASGRCWPSPGGGLCG